MLPKDIQVGRDHGLASYIEYAKLSGAEFHNRGRNFNDLYDRITPKMARILKGIYPTPAHIDLIVGLMAESSTASADALLGKTQACKWKLKM